MNGWRSLVLLLEDDVQEVIKYLRETQEAVLKLADLEQTSKMFKVKVEGLWILFVERRHKQLFGLRS